MWNENQQATRNSGMSLLLFFKEFFTVFLKGDAV